MYRLASGPAVRGNCYPHYRSRHHGITAPQAWQRMTLGEWACQVLMGGSDKYLYDEQDGGDKSAADALDHARKTAHLLAINALDSSPTSVALLIKGP